MSLSITKVCQAGSNEWDAIWKGCYYSTYFHSREWAEIWSDYTKQEIRPDPKLISFSDGKKALLPFSSNESLKGLVKRYVSSPAGTLGGWISTDDLHIEHAIVLMKYITKRFGNLIWRLNPYDKLVLETGLKITKNDVTHAINIGEGFDAVKIRWIKNNKSIERKARKARREGVLVKLATSLEDWHKYYEVYEDSLRRWGEKASSVYGWQLFQAILQRNSPHIKLWLAVHQEEIIAGALCFYGKKHVVYWHGAAFAKYFDLRPVNLLMYEIIKNACEQDCEWFDFNPSGGHEGVKAFKESFGAEALPCSIVITESSWAKLITKLWSIIH